MERVGLRRARRLGLRVSGDRSPNRSKRCVTAYQDGIWLGRATVPVDAIAPGEAPPEWN